MERLKVGVIAGLCLVSLAALAASQTFSGTGPTEPKACVMAENTAIAWIKRNDAQFRLNHQPPSNSECTCKGNKDDGYVCQVVVSY